MNDLLADVSGIQTTAGNIDEAAAQAMSLAGQVLSTAESTTWTGRADAAFVNAVEAFRDQKDRLGQLLSEISGNVDLAAMDHDSNEEEQVAGMNSKASMMA